MDQARLFLLAGVLFMVVALVNFGMALLGDMIPTSITLGSTFLAIGVVFITLARSNNARK